MNLKHKKESTKGYKYGRKKSLLLPKHCQACGIKYDEDNPHEMRTNHHIWVQRHFHGEGPVEILCQDCHTELDSRIPQRHKLKTKEYQKYFDDFIEEKNKEAKA